MRDHGAIDRRSLALARAVVARIDADETREGLRRAIDNCRRWRSVSDSSAHREWEQVLTRTWEDVRCVLLDESDAGQRLRQSSPFCGVLTPRERWQIYRSYADEA